MDCNGAQQQLSSYIDGVLSRVESTRVEIHLRACAECASVVAELQQLRAALAALPEVDVPSGFRRPLMERVAALPAPAAAPALAATATATAPPVPAARRLPPVAGLWRRSLTWGLPTAAAAALAAAVLFSAGTPGPVPTPDPRSAPGELARVTVPPGDAGAGAGPVMVPDSAATPPSGKGGGVGASKDPGGAEPAGPDATPVRPTTEPLSPYTPPAGPEATPNGEAAPGVQAPPQIAMAADANPTPAGSAPASGPSVATVPAPSVSADTPMGITSNVRVAGDSFASEASAVSTGFQPGTVVEMTAGSTLTVTGISEARVTLGDVVTVAGGRLEGEKRLADGIAITVRVPAKNLPNLLTALEQVGAVTSQEPTATHDLTDEFNSITASLQARHRELKELRDLVDSHRLDATVGADQMQVKLGEVAKLEGDLEVLGNRAGTAVVSVVLVAESSR